MKKKLLILSFDALYSNHLHTGLVWYSNNEVRAHCASWAFDPKNLYLYYSGFEKNSPVHSLEIGLKLFLFFTSENCENTRQIPTNFPKNVLEFCKLEHFYCKTRNQTLF